MYEYLPPNYRASYGTASFGLQKKKFELSTCAIKNLSDNENINSMMRARFLWQDNLPNQIYRYMIFTCPWQMLSYTWPLNITMHHIT